MKVGDHVQNIYHPNDTGIVAHIWTEWDCDPNPYCVGVQVDGSDNIQVFKPEHLKVLQGMREALKQP